MKLDTAIKTFYEKYDRDAIQSIETISKEYGLNIHGHTIKSFNITEAFNIFSKYLQGYSEYKIENANSENASSQETIKESVQKFINTQVFKECETKYSELPTFVTGYFNGVKTLLETVDEVKRNMTDNNVDVEAIGDINEFADMFMDKLHESFDPTMDQILWASGYNSKQRLSGTTTKTKAPVFL